MSRVAKTPVIIPAGVDVKIKGKDIFMKGKNGELIYTIHEMINIEYANKQLTFAPTINNKKYAAIAGTTRSLINGMVIGVTYGFIKKLQLVGVGYRATVKDNIVNLSLGFSHPINYNLPKGITAECTTQNEIIIKGSNKQILGQVAADLRNYRRPEPYKGKGVRYADEVIRIKEKNKK
ncbi:50S ribosomal protein L6 [secondary endosymbiont of Trabutina mannipara]|uniref:Large ribosomal subunit protein uL6 n=1 Tax=secondary endosymbiont of Trabutina mannipara TaxID=1835721 RepID=A0A1C3L486_9ENTR|nr:50S ribosomal protein L6 [secondary endosymbiont of Trabutina mannipara]SBT82098.1 50S ribosomal protein L6 [secondary endosymbiont of Trabutina mannipara]